MHLLIQPTFNPGDKEPENAGYLAWHEWAEVQYKSGLRQKQCGNCGLWRYPQDMSEQINQHECKTSRGKTVTVSTPVCMKCAKGEIRSE